MRATLIAASLALLLLTTACPAPPLPPEEAESASEANTEENAAEAPQSQPTATEESAAGGDSEAAEANSESDNGAVPGDVGDPCGLDADCRDGLTCEGEIGCDVVGQCSEPRPCTMDLVPYCNCEGETVRDSSTCPPFPVAHRGPCEE